ncbi:hypothetical protein HifGL_000836 [Haemophilus influenzae KR494]|nr:hypothetical protein HifGL_000836 [Haemophilus influenzae KR494]
MANGFGFTSNSNSIRSRGISVQSKCNRTNDCFCSRTTSDTISIFFKY